MPGQHVRDVDQPGGELGTVATDVVLAGVGGTGRLSGVRLQGRISLLARRVDARSRRRMAWVGMSTSTQSPDAAVSPATSAIAPP